jgi:formylglycine-generating enzyme required for sulfatase activity
MQGEAEQLQGEMSLQIARSGVARRFERYLKEGGAPDAFHLVERVIERLHARDAVLVQYGTDTRGEDLFGFVHRSFQEYFAACWMANELDAAEFRRRLFEARPGWDETLYLAVAQLPDRDRRGTLLELLKNGRAEFAVNCLRAAPPEQNQWLRLLVQFLARYTWDGQEYEGLTAGGCAEACAGKREAEEVLRAMFERENREGRSLAAAVELAEEFARRGGAWARGLIEAFFAEADGLTEDMVPVEGGPFPFGKEGRLVEVPAFSIDRYPVTNADFERMIPGHRKLRDRYSDTDRQPVIYVNWYEARLYARWRGCRLPSEEEWEKAAGWDEAGRHKRVYPWGDEFEAERCNVENRVGKTTPVGAYPAGRSACGCEDMAGNVWEWTESLSGGDMNWRVARGGAGDVHRGSAACACRNGGAPRSRNFLIGFRCART